MALLLAVALLASCASHAMPSPSPSPGNIVGLLEIPTFARKLARAALACNSGKNLILSPASVSVLLSILADSSRGDTSAQLHEVLGPSYWTARPAFAEGDDFRSTSGLWVTNKRGVASDFVSRARDKYGIEIQGINPPPPGKTINEWIHANGGEKLSVNVDQATLVAANVTRYSGEWRRRFDPSQTRPEPFVGLTRTTSISMMSQNGVFPEVDTNRGRLIGLPYTNGSTMYLFLPRFRVKNPLEVLLAEHLQDFGRQYEVIGLPRFAMQTSVPLVPALTNIGAAAPFSRRADFSPLTGAYGTPLGVLEDETWMKVDELGTQAQSVTVAAFTEKINPCVCFNRPFAFVLMDDGTHTAILIGQYVDVPGPS